MFAMLCSAIMDCLINGHSMVYVYQSLANAASVLAIILLETRLAIRFVNLTIKCFKERRLS